MNEKHLIFGATGGIGSEVCRQLRASNQTVAASGRNQSGLAELSKETGALTFPGDALEWETAADVAGEDRRFDGGLDQFLEKNFFPQLDIAGEMRHVQDRFLTRSRRAGIETFVAQTIDDGLNAWLGFQRVGNS